MIKIFGYVFIKERRLASLIADERRLCYGYLDLQAELKETREALKRAQRNDNRDPKTGRFVKRGE